MTATVEPTVPPPPAGPAVGPGTSVGAGAWPGRDGREFPCPQCGADLVYAIGEVMLRCPHCTYSRPVDLDAEAVIAENDYEHALEALRETAARRGAAASAEAKLTETVVCEGCGADVTFEGSVTALECSYCGTPLQRDHVHLDPERIPVDGVLPFEVDHAAAEQSLKRWVKGLWFAPSAFKKRGLRGDFQGVYLPFWTFDSLTFTRYRGERGVNVTTGTGKQRRTRTHWSPASGEFQRFFDDVLVLSARAVRATPMGSRLHALEPWPLGRLMPFRAEFLAGFQARTYDTGLEDGFSEAHGRMDNELRADVRRRIGGDQQRIHEMRSRFDAVAYKHVLLPLWLMSYRHQGKDMQVMVNAITGKVIGERPWSVWKILFAVLAVVGFFLFLRML